MAENKIDPAMTMWMENLSLRVLAMEEILKQKPYGISDQQFRKAQDAVRSELGLDNPPNDLFRRAHLLIDHLTKQSDIASEG